MKCRHCGGELHPSTVRADALICHGCGATFAQSVGDAARERRANEFNPGAGFAPPSGSLE